MIASCINIVAQALYSQTQACNSITLALTALKTPGSIVIGSYSDADRDVAAQANLRRSGNQIEVGLHVKMCNNATLYLAKTKTL